MVRVWAIQKSAGTFSKGHAKHWLICKLCVYKGCGIARRGFANLWRSESIGHSVKLTDSLDRIQGSNDRYSLTIFLNRRASSNISLLLKNTYERPSDGKRETSSSSSPSSYL